VSDVRIFIGIPTDDVLKEKLNIKQQDIKDFIKQGKMTAYENFHLTMLFIGDMNEKDMHLMKEKLVLSLLHTKSFYFVLNRLGSFKKGDTRIMWVGAKEHHELLQDLYQNIKQAVQQCHISFQDSPFHPHITLARQVKVKDDKRLENQSFESYPMKIGDVNIYLSSQVNGKLTYTPLHTIRLK
jgi:2'-5' RNA ligase